MTNINIYALYVEGQVFVSMEYDNLSLYIIPTI